METIEQFAQLLNRLHVRSGKKSYRDLERWADAQRRAGKETAPLSRSTITDALRGTRMPKKDFLRAFIEACDVPEVDRPAWISTWERLAERRHVAPVDDATKGRATSDESAEIAELREQVRRLTETVQGLSADLSRLSAAFNAGRPTLQPAQSRPKTAAVTSTSFSQGQRKLTLAMIHALDNCQFIHILTSRDLFMEILAQRLGPGVQLREHKMLRPQLVELVTKCSSIDGAILAIAELVELLEPGSSGTRDVYLVANEWAAQQLSRGHNLENVRAILQRTDVPHDRRVLESPDQRAPWYCSSGWEIFCFLATLPADVDGPPTALAFLARTASTVSAAERKQLSEFMAPFDVPAPTDEPT
ncbi:effector-associated domain 2-containing protein [Dactylosporangium sp. CA-139066]|uniref:effector-associated domain 2-containing protein n=1 Tax=Dactylosporangium sp. CA-139066 TaxID=3239930 RepID=UPI003D8CE2D1